MGQKYKYDVAISVAAEDVEVAKQIAAELKKRRIAYYLYTENEDSHWGQHIFKILLRSFGADARYVLMITSKIFIEKYWSNIETLIVSAFQTGRPPYILQLCLDETELSITKNIAHKKWKDNPAEIAEVIWKKLNPAKKVRPAVLWCISIFTVVVIGSVLLMKSNNTSDHAGMNLMQSTKSNSTFTFNRKPIPAGAFVMGLDAGANGDAPLHEISLKQFFISPTEVTVAQFQAYCTATGQAMPQQPEHRFQQNCPVVNVTWHQAAAYCQWAGGRLPAEAEWEYAASGATGGKYSGGNNAKNVAIYNQPKHSQVALRDSNSYGLFDMTGNVAEWCADWYDPNYYSTDQAGNPKGPLTGTEKVVRGGSFINYANELNLRYRGKEHPDSARLYIGFRVVWDK